MAFGLSQDKKREDWWKSGFFYEFGNPPNLSNIESFIANSFHTKEAVKKVSISKKILNHYEIDKTKFYKEILPTEEGEEEKSKELDLGKLGEELYNICIEYAIPARDLVIKDIQSLAPEQEFVLLLDYFDKLSIGSGVPESIRNYEYKRFYQIFYSKDVNLVITYNFFLEEIGDDILDTTINFNVDITTLESVYSKISENFFNFDAFKTYDNLERKKKPLGSIYALSGGSMNSPPNLSKLGKIKQKLCPENYSEQVMKEIVEAKLHLQKTNPRGRMIILNGPPGTGKTTLVKHFIAECIGTYIYVPIEAIQTLMNPSIWEVFADYKDESHPFVLILEDADAYLSIRNKKNVSKISHLLNIGDGIIGASLDIRIVATTNCQQEDIDPAFLRPGRLNSRIEIGKLSKKECLNFLKEKGKEELKDKLPKNKMTLAELYAFINYENKENSNKVHT